MKKLTPKQWNELVDLIDHFFDSKDGWALDPISYPQATKLIKSGKIQYLKFNKKGSIVRNGKNKPDADHLIRYYHEDRDRYRQQYLELWENLRQVTEKLY